jgi:hypothetical protein
VLCQKKVEPDLRAGFSTLWFDRTQLRVGENAHHHFCTMRLVVDISQLKPAISNFRTAQRPPKPFFLAKDAKKTKASAL